jgi:hypothetical protein
MGTIFLWTTRQEGNLVIFITAPTSVTTGD